MTDPNDVCVFAKNPLQEVTLQDGLVGIGCACLCGDVNNSCTITVTDVDDIQATIIPNLDAQPGCTKNNAGLCGTPQILEVRGCDADGSGTPPGFVDCTVSDVDLIQRTIPLLLPGPPPPFPLPNGYSPTNCAQTDPNPITPF